MTHDSRLTTRLYYTDATLLSFDASVVGQDGDAMRIILDQTAFYPTSGGQPHDLGTLNGVPVIDVLDDDNRVIHVLSAPLAEGVVHGEVDATRRRDHMEQHTAQHLLSAIAADHFGWETLSVHFGVDHSTIEFDVAAATEAQRNELMDRARAVVMDARPVTLSFESSVEAVAAGLRKAPPREGELRVVTIAGVDRSACGGTHLGSTAEIGAMVWCGEEKMRGHLRLSYLAGGRVLRHLQARDQMVAALARGFSCAEGELVAVATKRQDELRELRSATAALEEEVASHRVHALLAAADPDEAGIRRVVHHATTESATLLRAMAQRVATESKAVLLLVAPPTIMVGSSADSDCDAGVELKAALAAVGGRGGGSPRLAQGSVADPAALVRVVALLTS